MEFSGRGFESHLGQLSIATSWSPSVVNTIYDMCIWYVYMVFTTEVLLEVAIESWPGWDLNPRPPNSVQTL